MTYMQYIESKLPKCADTVISSAFRAAINLEMRTRGILSTCEIPQDCGCTECQEVVAVVLADMRRGA